MRENKYQKLLEQIQAPETLEERVLMAARQRGVRAPARRKQPVGKAAVCAVLALMLVLGGISLRPVEETMEFSYEFGLTAYAAENRMGVNGGLLLGGGTGPVTQTTDLRPEKEQYTNYRFQIRGENLETLTMTLDRGGLYRAKTGQGMVLLENHAIEKYDPDAIYGLWVPPQEWVQGRGNSMLNGAELTVTAHFADGGKRTHVYRLTVQKLLVSRNEDGTELLVPALEGTDQTGVSGLYLEPLNSVWFQWPVEGSHTVSLSNRYGFRVAPGGQGETFHAGIDIPAESGTAITAAAGGTVTEADYDAALGNYLILDHGNGMETVYGQCLSLSVETGDTVEAGEEIAAVGSTGLSTGPHLHFEVRQNGDAQNPVAYFDSEVRGTLKMG